MATHYDIVRLGEVASTQDEATTRFAATGRPVLVVAERQVAGRGRGGRSWLDADRGLSSSLAFGPAWEPKDLGLVPLVTAVSVRRAIGDDAGVDIKWPNDLLIDDRKVGGILVEGSDGIVAVGVGINLWWRDPPAFATSLLAAEPEGDVAGTLARRWTEELLAITAAPVTRWPSAEYREACVTLGKRVRWDGGVGTATDVADDGALVVDGDDGRHVVLSGDVHLLDVHRD